jgi:hypothetical protein
LKHGDTTVRATLPANFGGLKGMGDDKERPAPRVSINVIVDRGTTVDHEPLQEASVIHG